MSSDTKNTPIAELRQRMLSWDDPHIGTAISKAMSGLDYIRALIDGSVPPPPIVSPLRMRAVSAEAGQVTFNCDPDELDVQPDGCRARWSGLCSSGFGARLRRSAHTSSGQGYTSVDITVSYLRPVFIDTGRLTAVGRVSKPGTRVTLAEGTVHDSSGKLVATAASTLLVFPC